MLEQMRAINDYIVVDVEKVGPKKVGGLLLTEELDETNRYIKATIISTGNLVEGLKDKDIIYRRKNNRCSMKKKYGFTKFYHPIVDYQTTT